MAHTLPAGLAAPLSVTLNAVSVSFDAWEAMINHGSYYRVVEAFKQRMNGHRSLLALVPPFGAHGLEDLAVWNRFLSDLVQLWQELNTASKAYAFVLSVIEDVHRLEPSYPTSMKLSGKHFLFLVPGLTPLTKGSFISTCWSTFWTAIKATENRRRRERRKRKRSATSDDGSPASQRQRNLSSPSSPATTPPAPPPNPDSRNVATAAAATRTPPPASDLEREVRRLTAQLKYANDRTERVKDVAEQATARAEQGEADAARAKAEVERAKAEVERAKADAKQATARATARAERAEAEVERLGVLYYAEHGDVDVPRNASSVE